MDESTVAFLKGLISFVVVAGTALGGTWMWFHVRAKYRATPNAALDAVRDEQARLEAELGSRMTELEDRVDFVERRLVQERPPTNLPPQRERTPV